MTRPRILVVEDDTTLREGLREALRNQGFEVEVLADGIRGVDAARDARQQYDLWVLDLMLPGASGLEILRAFRARDTVTPVLILTARGDEHDKVLGLELGADDYVTKPFSLRELLARIRAHLRRSPRLRDDTPETPEPFTLGAARIDLAAFELTRDGTTHALSPKEAGILALLWRERGRAVSRDQILDVVWGRDSVVTHRTIDTHVLHLRQKLEDDHREPRFVRTVHGIGYRLLANDEDAAP